MSKEKLCNSCRRKTSKGVNTCSGSTTKNEFCSMSQQSLNNLNPIICNHFKEFYQPVYYKQFKNKQNEK